MAVQVDEVNRRGVEAAQDVQVVPGPDGSVGEVGHCELICREQRSLQFLLPVPISVSCGINIFLDPDRDRFSADTPPTEFD